MLSKADAICRGMLARIKAINRDMSIHLDEVTRAIDQLGERGWITSGVASDIADARKASQDGNLYLKRLQEVINERFTQNKTGSPI